MKYRIINLSLTFISSVLFFCTSLCTTIGSDTNPTRFNTIQILNNGDRVAAFAALAGGFKLLDSTTTATWDSVFPASGQVGLRSGTLFLEMDLILYNVLDFETFGNIIGNNHTLNIIGGGGILPTRADNCAISFGASAAAGGTNLSSDWFLDNSSIAYGFTTASSGVGVYTFNGVAFTLKTTLNFAGSATQVNDVRCHPSIFSCAVVRTQSTGPELEVVSYNPAGPTLTSTSSDSIAAGNYVACAWHPSGNFLAVGSTQSGSELKIYPFNALTGVLGTASTFTITPHRDIQRAAMDWSADGQSLAVGVANVAPNADLLVYQFQQSPINLTLDASTVVSTGIGVLSTSWNPVQTNFLAIGVLGGLTDSVFLFQYDSGASTLTQVSGISDLNSTAVQTVDFSPDGNCLGVGRDPFGGNGVVRTYAFDNPIFTQASSRNATTAVTSFRYSPSGQFQVTSQAGATTLLGGFEQLAFTSMPSASWSNLHVLLSNDVLLQNCIILLSGNNIINGQSGRLTLDSTCELLVAHNSQLTLKDVTLRGVNTNSLQLTDSTSTLIFDNVRMILDNNYSFTLGQFNVVNQLIIEGNGFTFNYMTNLQSTVTSHAQLILREGVTFNYAPTIASKTLLQLLDSTSSIMLNGATLTTTTTAIRLTKGTLFIEGQSFLSNAGTVLGQAIEFGDGVAADNLNVEWLPAAQLQLLQGFLRNRNV